MLESIYRELNDLITNNLTSILDTCNKVLSFIDSKPQEIRLLYFKTLLKEFDISNFDIDDLDSFLAGLLTENTSPEENNIRQMGNSVISNLVKKNGSEEEFYKDLWRILHDDILVSGKENQAFLLAQFWMDVRTPYFQLENSCTMENKEFSNIIVGLKDHIKKAFYILHAGLPEKTQKTSLLMNIADTIPSERARAVFWAVVMDRESFRQMYLRKYNEDQEDED